MGKQTIEAPLPNVIIFHAHLLENQNESTSDINH